MLRNAVSCLFIEGEIVAKFRGKCNLLFNLIINNENR